MPKGYRLHGRFEYYTHIILNEWRFKMKEVIKTITKEYDNEGRLIKETEVTTEKEYDKVYIPFEKDSGTPPYKFPPITYL
jgi:hypothetical protein